MSPNHPFDPLTSREIAKAAAIVRRDFPAQTPNFRVITLKEPAKDQMIPFLDDQNRGENSSKRPARTARVQVVLPGDWAARFVELWVDLDRAVIIKKEHLVGKHPYIDSDYMQAVEKACIEDPRIQEQIALLELPAGATVIVEAWAYATDGLNDMSQRITMGWFYMRLVDDVDANYYAYPLDLCAEVSEDLKVTKIYQLPSGIDDRINDKPKPFDRRKIHGAETEYSPGLRSSPRTTTKPYQVIQPEGPSFKTQGNFLEWEKWSMHIGFNYREGLTLHDIRYEGRSLFYRISLAEMFVPYGDPRTPYPRKAAFDLGNDGAGINANNLRLGCDCLGHIKYFDGWHTTTSGDPVKLPNVICCHEQDDGILWKHTNFRTQNAVVARSRILVLQTIITVSNYEYIFAFHLGQDASIHYEVRATGILSTTPINVGDNVPYGTVVAPGVLAPYHQHLFSLRMDPSIDGHNNSLQIEESYPMPIDTPTFDHTGKTQAQVDSYANPFGVGYATRSSIVDHEGGLDLDFTKNRTFKIINENVINPVTGTPVGFKLLPAYSQMLLAHPESYHAKRSEFATHAVWVTRHNDEEHFPSGRHTMQSVGGDGIATAIANRSGTEESLVRNKDIVVWHTFGSTHNPRIEDWPAMPSEKMTVGLKPVNFFTGNPGLDVALSTQESNRSVLVDGGDDTKPKSDCCKL